MTENHVVFDIEREGRIGLPEAVFCEGKSLDQIISILGDKRREHVSLSRALLWVFALLGEPRVDDFI